MTSDSKIESLKKIYGGPMTPAEIEVLNDIKGFIDVAIRNGLSFALVIGTLGHDVNNLARHGFDMERATKDGFAPKVAGYSQITPDSVGEPEESIE
ncbi:MAG: hypothetical protein ABSH35_03780 [Isosphaeraceae bacterium]|jgi:hypothetical protein